VILVVDDDNQARSMIVAALASFGFKTAEAVDGPTALVLARNTRFEAVILDFVMPGMTGAETAEELARIDPDLPIIFATGYADEAALHQELGRTVPVLHKPFPIWELASVLTLVTRQVNHLTRQH